MSSGSEYATDKKPAPAAPLVQRNIGSESTLEKSLLPGRYKLKCVNLTPRKALVSFFGCTKAKENTGGTNEIYIYSIRKFIHEFCA